MINHTYRNPWMPKRALDILANHSGTILDIGGGAAPYFRASHVLDIIPFDSNRLARNAWGGEAKFTASQYTAADICSGKSWPFADGQFDLGLCSHTLEDLRDPLPAMAEMGRVCKQMLIVCPSRLLEQTKGIEHPRYCGFYHHPWAVDLDGSIIIFRRKTSIGNLPGNHLVCPFGKRLTVDAGTFVYHGPKIASYELAYWSEVDDARDYREYLKPFRERNDLFTTDPRPRSWKRWVYYLRQKYLGVG